MGSMCQSKEKPMAVEATGFVLWMEYTCQIVY